MATAASGLMLTGLRFTKIETSSSSTSGSLKLRVSSDLTFLTSQMSGIKLSTSEFNSTNSSTSISYAPLNPVAHFVCKLHFFQAVYVLSPGRKHTWQTKFHFQTKKLQFVNLQYKRVWWEAGNRYVKLRLSTKALKTIEKIGLDAVMVDSYKVV
ncbi:hypothetical protein MKX01_019604 [Papaver californicum]|nr:hypothetical protein MKX01_019604 [Papaver californicum]